MYTLVTQRTLLYMYVFIRVYTPVLSLEKPSSLTEISVGLHWHISVFLIIIDFDSLPALKDWTPRHRKKMTTN